MRRLHSGSRAFPIAVLALGLCWLAEPVAGQFVQYTPPGAFQPSREDTATILERHMDNARWRTGRVLLDPWFSVRNFGYLDPVAGTEESDVTFTLGAGLRGWLPVGSELTLAAHALPEYVWWNELSERNRWNGRYGAGLFGNLGRTGLELTATRVEDAQYFSRELEDQVNTRTDEARAELEIAIGGGLQAFAGGSFKAVRYLEQEDRDLPLSVVDRNETVGRAGLSYTLPRGLRVGLGAEYSRADFGQGPGDRSNSGTAPLLLLDFSGRQLEVAADLAYRALTPQGDSRFVDYDGLTGRFQAGWKPAGRLELQLYGGNDLVYSFTGTWAYFEDNSIGLGLRGAVTPWATGRIFFETGNNDYTIFDRGGPRRRDDYDSWGLDFAFRLNRVQLTLGWWQTDYTSNLPAFDRQTSSSRSGVSFGLGSGVSWN